MMSTKDNKREPFVIHERSLLASAAWRSLGNTERRILDRLEIEHIDRKGKHNGDLIVTYTDLLHYGIGNRNAIAAALRVLVRRGLLRIAERGRWNQGIGRKAARYRLTYLPARDAEPTGEWRAFQANLPPIPVRSDSGKSKKTGTETVPQYGTETVPQSNSRAGTVSVPQSGYGNRTTSTHLKGVQGEGGEAAAGEAAAAPRAGKPRPRLGSSPLRTGAANGAASTNAVAKLAKLPWTKPTVQ